MKHAKKLLACLLAGVLALAVLTACDGVGAVATAGTDAEKGQALAQELGKDYDESLENQAAQIANWVADSTSLTTEGVELLRYVPLNTDNMSYLYTDKNYFLDLSGCTGILPSVTVGIRLSESNVSSRANLYVPQLDGAQYTLTNDAAGSTKMGAAFIEYNGTTYVVAVFQ